MIKKINAISYARFSSKNQREESIETQEAAIDDYAEKNNIRIVKHFSDKAISGTSVKHRDGFKTMVDYCIEHDDVELVICYRLDRMSRDIYDYLEYRKRLYQHGKRIYFVADNFEASDDTFMMEALKSILAGDEITKLRRNVSDGLKTNAKKCIHTGGIPCLGYNINSATKKLEINENERPIIEMIFNMYGDGYSYKDIIDELNKYHFKTKLGNEFKENSLHDILINPKYKGTYVYNRRSAKNTDGARNNHTFKPDDEMIIVEGGCPAIIDEELWNKVQKRMAENKSKLHKYSSKEIYLLRDKIFCECGERMYGNRRYSGRNKQLYVTYGCKGRQSKSGCKVREINRDYIESFVIRQIGNFIFNKSNIKKLILALNEYSMEVNGNINREIKMYEKKLNKLNHELNNIVNAVANGYKNPKFIEKSDCLSAEIASCNESIEELKNTDSIHFTENDILCAKRKFIAKLKSNDVAARLLIDKYVEKVIIGKEEINVILSVDADISDSYR